MHVDRISFHVIPSFEVFFTCNCDDYFISRCEQGERGFGIPGKDGKPGIRGVPVSLAKVHNSIVVNCFIRYCILM